MFKVNKLIKLEKERITINKALEESYNLKTKEKGEKETLEFDIEGEENDITYSLSFILNCTPENLLNITDEDDFTKYIHKSERYFNINDENIINLDLNAKIIRKQKNKFIIALNFIADETFAGIIDFEIDLDNYITK